MHGVTCESGRVVTASGWESEGHDHRRYIRRLLHPAHVAEKICTVVILGIAIAEFLKLRWGQLLVNLYINPKLTFKTLSDLYGRDKVN